MLDSLGYGGLGVSWAYGAPVAEGTGFLVTIVVFVIGLGIR